VKDDRAYLLHIREEAARIATYTAQGSGVFLADTKTQDAVIRNLEIIGEAVKNVSSALKANHPDLPWRKIAGMRDKLIHGYFGVNLDLVWETVEREIPRLVSEVDQILEGGGVTR
jgi:uncharacterized protein with HEPN domain